MRRPLSIEDARQALARTDHSYSRMDKLAALFFQMSVRDWHVVLGEEWNCCDNISSYRLLLRRLLPQKGPVAGMMTREERAVYDALPERLTIYRGCGPSNVVGVSWSLAREAAAKFPLLDSYREPHPLLITGTVSRERVLALKFGRGGDEVITFGARRVGVESLPLAAAE